MTASTFVSIPVVSSGAGTAVDASALGFEKNFVVGGTFSSKSTGVIVVEASADAGSTWFPVATFDRPGDQSFVCSCSNLRSYAKGDFDTWVPTLKVGADACETQSSDMNVPASNGTGTALDVSTYGVKKTIYVSGSFDGSVTIEGSLDSSGTTFSPIQTFNSPGGFVNDVQAWQRLRVRLSGWTTGTPVVMVSASNDDVGTGYTVLQMSFNQPADNIDIYVDATNGVDTNDGLTSTTALQTIGEVYRRFPKQIGNDGQMVIHLLGDGTTNQVEYPVNAVLIGGMSGFFNTYCYRGPAMIVVTPATGSGTVVGGLTATQVGQRTRIDVAPNPGWTVNDLRGKFLRVTRAGEQVFFEMPISENDADSIFIDTRNGISANIQAGDTIEIVQPAVKLLSTNTSLCIFLQGQAGCLPTDATFWGAGSDIYQAATFERIHLGDYPVMAGVYGLSFDRCVLDNTPFFKGGSVGFINCICTLGIKLSCDTFEFAIQGRPDSPTSPINQAVTDASVELLCLDILLIGNPDGIGCYKAYRNVSVYNQSNANRGAIHVVGYGSMFWASDATDVLGVAVSLVGSGNAGPFVWCIHGGQARINTTAGATPNTQGTGTGSPLRVGQGAAIAYGTGVGAFEEVAGFNGNFQRFLAGTVTAPTGDGSRIFLNA